MAADELLVVEKVPFTIVTNKKGKGKERPTPVPSQNMSLATAVSRVPSLS